jgi:hypothetical protein
MLKVSLLAHFTAPAGNGTATKDDGGGVNGADLNGFDLAGSRHQQRKILAAGPLPPRPFAGVPFLLAWEPSDTHLSLHSARGDGGLERREVSLVLVGIGLGERGHRPVEGVRLAEIRALTREPRQYGQLANFRRALSTRKTDALLIPSLAAISSGFTPDHAAEPPLQPSAAPWERVRGTCLQPWPWPLPPAGVRA